MTAGDRSAIADRRYSLFVSSFSSCCFRSFKVCKRNCQQARNTAFQAVAEVWAGKMPALRAQVFFQLRFAIVQGLQTQLPAMQLNGQLIDVTGDLGALRFVFF